MIRFDFVLSKSEQELRNYIDDRINADETKKILLGYRRGIHFKRNDRFISGFYNEDDDTADGQRGTPLRVYFCGKIVTDKDLKVHLKGIVYPSILQFLLLLVLLATGIFFSENLVPSVIYTTVFFVFLYGFVKSELELYRLLEKIFV